jgi:sugar lactone lactonase YvrE
MTFNVLRILANAAATAVLAGCAIGSSPLERPAAASLYIATYPPGAYRAARAAASLPFIYPLHGSASYDAHAAHSLVYVSNFGGNAVEVFRQRGRAQQPIATITNGIVFPDGLATDSSGNLYVTDSGKYNGEWVVQRYAPGSTSPGETYATDLSEPSGIAIGKDGTMYIANFNDGSSGWVAVYPRGSESKEYRLSDFSGGAPVSVALDLKQNLYVMYALGNQGSSAVNEYKPGAKTGKNLNLDFAYGAGIQVDSEGNLLVVQQVLPSEILVFSPGTTQPSHAIILPNGGEPYGLALNRGSKLLFAGDAIGNVVDRFAYPSGKFQYPIAGGFSDPAGFVTEPSEF